MSLPHDITRCRGVGHDAEGWREGCQDCRRRTSTGGPYTPHMDPPELVDGKCGWRIKPKPVACYVASCHAPCDRAQVAATRRPEWGDIVAPPDVVELDDGMGSTVCARAQYTRKDEA